MINSLEKGIVSRFHFEGNDGLRLISNLKKAGFEIGNPCYIIKVGKKIIGKVYFNGNMRYVLDEGYENYRNIIRNTLFDGF